MQSGDDADEEVGVPENPWGSAGNGEWASVVAGADFQEERAGGFDPLLRGGILRGGLGEAGGEHVGVDDARV